MASLLDACSPPLIRTVIANPTAGSGLKWVGRAFRGFRRVSAAGGRIGRMSAPEGITAIRASDLGLNPTNDGKVVRIPIPAPTEERRKELVKHIHKVLENHRTAVRNIRRDIKEAIDKLEKDKKISQDEQKRALDELEKLSHSETKKIEDLSAAKEKEVMEIR